MEINDRLLLAIYKDKCFAVAGKIKNYGYSTMDQLREGVRALGISGYVKSNTETTGAGISFGEPGASLDVDITSAGKAYLRSKNLI